MLLLRSLMHFWCFKFHTSGIKDAIVHSSSLHPFMLLLFGLWVFLKILSSPFHKINAFRSNYCAVVLWCFLYLHIVIMDHFNCSWNSYFSFLFLHICQIPIVTSLSYAWWIYFTAMQQSQLLVLCKALHRVRAAEKYPHCCLQAVWGSV